MSEMNTTTAATPEELARTADLRASLDRAYAIASPTGAANHLAAWANNHGKALLDLAEAQRAEIERLKEQNADLEKAALTAYENGVDHAFEAAKEKAEAALAAVTAERDRMREALTVAANRLDRCAIDHPAGSREMSERSEWAEEARAAMSAKEAIDER